MTLSVKTDASLLSHLKEFDVDGSTVESALFAGGRLTYPGRRDLEMQLGFDEPYTIGHEARVVIGLPPPLCKTIRLLANNALFVPDDIDPTLHLLWSSHSAWSSNGISLDRIVAAAVMVEYVLESGLEQLPEQRLAVLEEHSLRMIDDMRKAGFPLTRRSLEELFDGADPACVGLNLVEL